MGHPTSSSHPHPAPDHAAPPETEEQRQDREHSEAVELRWRRALVLPGAILALLSAGLSLAWIGSLGRLAPSMSWTWLLVLLLVFGWSLALARGPRDAEGS